MSEGAALRAALLYGWVGLLAAGCSGSESTARDGERDSGIRQDAQADDDTEDGSAPQKPCAQKPCFEGVACEDKPQSEAGYACGPCPAGFVGDGVSCSDADDCAPVSCGEHSTCVDRKAPLAGYDCECDAGFANSEGSCVELDACASAPCGPNEVCSDEPAPSLGFTCACAPNTTLGRAGGCQLDGEVTVSGAVNLSVSSLTGRTCADGGDAVHYSVVGLTATSVTLAQPVAAGCVMENDLFALINLQGAPGKTANVGRFEWVTVSSLAGATVTLKAARAERLGESPDTDDNIGLSAGQQRVAFVRVPTYQGLHIEALGELTVSSFDGMAGGALFLNVLGVFENEGKLHADGRGYLGGAGGAESAGGYQGLSLDGVSAQNSATGVDRTGPAHLGGGGGGGQHQQLSTPYRQKWCGSGAGGGYLEAGQAGGQGDTYNWQPGDPNYLNGSVGGASYGVDFSARLYFGSGGGGGAGFSNAKGGPGGGGGGIVFVRATEIRNSGTISSSGAPGGEADPSNSFGAGRGGGGAGGSVLLDSVVREPKGTVSVAGGSVASSTGSVGGVGSPGRTAFVP